MRSLSLSLIVTLFQAHIALASQHQTDAPACKADDTIIRDVAIIGCGSAGTNAAITLKDMGKSIIVIEEKAQIGGHVATYKDPTTGSPVDYAVLVFHNNSIVRDYFKRFDVPLVSNSMLNMRRSEFDFRTGNPVNVTTPSPEAVGAALAKYVGFLSQYPELDRGLFLPDPVPSDLLIPFQEFAVKYGIEAGVQTLYGIDQGAGDYASQPTVENIRVNGLSLTQQGLTGGLVSTLRRNNSEIYGKAQDELLAANSLLLSSTVTHSNRTDTGVELTVKTPQGHKRIRAKKLLITIPLLLDSLKPFSLNSQEHSVFEKLTHAGYYAALVTNTGIPDSVMPWNAVSDTAFNIPRMPAAYTIQPTRIPGLRAVYYGTPRTKKSGAAGADADERVKKDMINMIKKLQAANSDQFNKTEPQIVAFQSHEPFHFGGTAEDIKNGLYRDMYALQGLRSTHYSGAPWKAHDSSMLWQFNKEIVIPGILKALEEMEA